MQYMGLNEVRDKFLTFFESKEHLRLESASLVPIKDKSLLLINSGMAPLKPYFTGAVTPPSKRVATCQKCIRTPDIDRVGKTARHGTFFEMLGNFSFGDYFKSEATSWAWEFCTEVMELPKERLWVSIYLDDDEAFDIWTKEVGVPAEKIVRLGKADNFWEHGAGPCGPCSEIYYDRGEESGCGSDSCAVGCDCDRYVEFWNLVFTQFDGDGKGNYERLASPNIDTGMGLERLAAIMQGAANLFEVDTVMNITNKVTELLGVKYGESAEKDISLRVITDHIRSTTMMVSDGIIASNEGRGYILRRLLRRAARHGKLLGCNEPFLYKVCDTVIDVSGEAYPNLLEKRDFIKRIIKIEEESFIKTIEDGLVILQDIIKRDANKKIISGEDAFKLYDTYGFPIDLTKEIAEEASMEIDMDGFDALMQEQRKRARDARAKAGDQGWTDTVLAKLPKGIESEFVGYEKMEAVGEVLAIIKGDDVADSIQEGESGIIITDITPFYPEGGGQIADVGMIKTKNFEASVNAVTRTGDNKILHNIVCESGIVEVGESVELVVMGKRRVSVERNHTATHILYKVLRDTLGEHVSQAGSLVTEERLRFDFTHFEALTDSEINSIEDAVNEIVLSSIEITKNNMSLKAAQDLGAVANFDEKYGDEVRVVSIAGVTDDLCGGCHLNNTSQIGLFKIVSEGGIAAGVRRIEAVTGKAVLDLLKAREDLINMAANELKTKPTDLVTRAKSFSEEHTQMLMNFTKLKSKMASAAVKDIMTSKKEVNGIAVLTAILPDMDMEELKIAADKVKENIETVCAVFASIKDDKINFFGIASKSAVDKGAHIGNVIKEVANIAGGKGGGKAESAQAGGKFKEKTDDALAIVDDMIIKQTNK